MASHTKMTKARRNNRAKKAGRRRKNRQAQHSTLSAVELFASLGVSGKPAPKTK